MNKAFLTFLIGCLGLLMPLKALGQLPNDAAFVVSETHIPGFVQSNESFPVAITIMNTGTNIWTDSDYQLTTIRDDCSLFPFGIGLAFGTTIPNRGTYTFLAQVLALSFNTTCHAEFQMEQAGVQPFGEIYSVDITFGETLNLTFSGGSGQANGWIGAVTEGTATTAVNSNGLCMGAPLTGDNIAFWVSPERFIELTDMTVYRVRVTLSTDQTAPDRIPLWDILFDNYNSNGFGNIYGGAQWFLDVAGGAEGIGRGAGRSQFDTYFVPNAVQTPQWRGFLSDGTVGAFDPAVDDINDFRIAIRILDLGSSGFLADSDFGTICMSALQVDAFPLNSFFSQGVVFNAPISTVNYAPFPYGQNPVLGVIDDNLNRAEYILGTGYDRATLLPAAGGAPYSIPSLYPVTWLTDQLYLIEAFMQVDEDYAGSDPVDSIWIEMDTPTVEIGQTSWTTRGSIGNFYRTASLRNPTVASGAQVYTAYAYGNNVSIAPIANSNLLRPLITFLNTPTLFGNGTGADKSEILEVRVTALLPPRF